MTLIGFRIEVWEMRLVISNVLGGQLRYVFYVQGSFLTFAHPYLFSLQLIRYKYVMATYVHPVTVIRMGQ